MSKALSVLRTLVRQKSDQENSTFITDSELNSILNQSLSTLRDMLIGVDPERFMSTTVHAITTVGNTSIYALADDHYKIKALDLAYGTYTYDIEPKSFRGRNQHQYENLLISSFEAAPLFYYTDLGQNVRISPTPTSVYTINVWYIPNYTELSADIDTTEVAIQDQWLEWALLDAAIKIKVKAEEDIQGLAFQKKDIEKKIESIAKEKLFSQPQKALDINTHRYR